MEDLVGTKLSKTEALEGHVDKWAKLWKEDRDVPKLVFGKVARLPPLSVSCFVEAAKTFKRGTCSLRGIHPRHFSLLDNSAIAALIRILHVAEAHGCLPPQLMSVIIALLPKPAGGERPVGWYQSLYRVWIKSRSCLVQQWEKDHTHDYGFAAQSNRSPIDVVWRQACLSEIAKSNALFFVSVLWDLWKCYDSVDHERLIVAAHKHGYPVAVLRLALLSYRAPRRITFRGIVSREVLPTASIVAGNATATTELRLLLLDLAISMATHHSNVSLNIFIDDIVLDAMSDDKHQVVRDMCAATEDLAFLAQDQCNLLIAAEKSAVLSNSIPIAGLVRRCLKDLGGPALGSVRSLGVDFWAAAPIKPPMKVRKNRFAKVALKRPRLNMLKRSSPKAAAKVYVCGVLPGVLFDMPVYGLFGRSLHKLRREAAFFCGLGGRKRSLDLSFAFGQSKDPEVLSALAVVSRFATEIWNASLPPQFRDKAGLSLGTLGLGIKGHMDSNPTPPTDVHGPISAFHKTIAKAGWSFSGPFLLATNEGGVMDMRVSCPRKVTQSFRIDLCNAITLRAVQRKVDDNPNLHANCYDILTNGLLLKPLVDMARHLSSRDRQTLVAITSNGIFTNTDLMWMGYDINPVCTNCNLALDTVYHRCVTCPAIEPVARQSLGDRLFDRLVAEGDSSVLANYLWMPKPPMNSFPSVKGEFTFVNTVPGEPFFKHDGAMFGDGSVLFPNVDCLARAGYAIAQVKGDGTLHKAIYASLPDSMDQTAINSEYAAFALASHAAEEGCVYAGDCSAVINAHAHGLKEALSAKNSHACVWKALDQKMHLDSVFSAVLKVKAHRSLKDIPLDDEDARFLFFGNEVVDELAKKAAGLHPPSLDDVRGYRSAVKDLKALAMHMIDVLGVLRMSRLEKDAKAPRLPRGLTIKMGNDDDHEFIWVNTFWCCTKCLGKTHSLSSIGQSRRKCIGRTPFDSLLLDPKGHNLHVAILRGGGIFVYCSTCFCYANPHPRKLNEVCRGNALNNPFSRFYILKGRHPVSRRELLRPRRVHA